MWQDGTPDAARKLRSPAIRKDRWPGGQARSRAGESARQRSEVAGAASTRHPVQVHRARALVALVFALIAGGAISAEARPLARVDHQRPPPRLQLMVSPVLGPRSLGEQLCFSRGTYEECRVGGRFLGLGGTLELRARAVGPLYVHLRGLLVGNIAAADQAVHRGLGGAGFGLGAYARLGFVRAEYLALDTLGPPTYTPPFGAAGAATDTYGHHAALLSGGARLPYGARANLELWGGALIGPRATRVTTTPTEDNQRVLFTFLLGLGLSFDLIPGPRAAPAAPAPAGP